MQFVSYSISRTTGISRSTFFNCSMWLWQHKKSAFYSFELQKMYFSDIVFCLKSENAHLVHHSKIGAWFYLKIMLLLSMPQKSCTYNFDENEAWGTTFLSNNLKWIKQSLGYASNYDICLDTFYLLRRNFINHKKQDYVKC